MGDIETPLRTPDLGPGEIREVEVRGEVLLVTNIGQTYYAMSAFCPNDGVNLARDGELQGDKVVCPGDLWAFDVRTGTTVEPGGEPGLRRYAITIDENRILIGEPVSD